MKVDGLSPFFSINAAMACGYKIDQYAGLTSLEFQAQGDRAPLVVHRILYDDRDHVAIGVLDGGSCHL